jgi:DNA topoisomerase-1
MKTLKKIPHKDFVKIHHNPELTASAVNLVYVSDTVDGIRRIKKGNDFSYTFKDAVVKDKEVIDRIKKLAIPPAWQKVWICNLENGHLQATGYDARMRKQYRYHALWNYLRNETKFHNMLEFGKALPLLRLRLEKDMSQTLLNETKVIATVISLMERTYIRIGNESYEKANGSYGLTTLKDKHVAIKGDTLKFSFKGKKSIDHQITLKNKKLAKAVKDCRDIPGRELFQYYDADGQHKSIDSSMVNNYIKEATGGSFTAKDFRTWAGSLSILHSFSAMEDAMNETDKKKNVLKALDEVSNRLGNTRTVCRKYYVHPGIIEMYENNKLQHYIKQLNQIEVDDNIAGLTLEEQVLMKVLKSGNSNTISLEQV